MKREHSAQEFLPFPGRYIEPDDAVKGVSLSKKRILKTPERERAIQFERSLQVSMSSSELPLALRSLSRDKQKRNRVLLASSWIKSTAE